MNPSRIGTPVRKEIDIWHFQFNEKIIPFHIDMHRARDAQKQRDEAAPVIKFQARVEEQDLVKAGVEPGMFITTSLKSPDINALRKACEDYVHHMLSLTWRKVIVVGFSSKTAEESPHEPAITLTFDYAVVETETTGQKFRNPGEVITGYANKKASNVINGFCWDDKNVHVFEYSDALLETLAALKARYRELNDRIASLVSPVHVETLITSLSKLLPAPKP